MLIFLPIAVVYFIDRKKGIILSWPYFFIYIFLVGSFALLPVGVVASLYSTFEG